MGKKTERWLEGEERRQALLADLAGDYSATGKIYGAWVTSWPEGLNRTFYAMYPPVIVPARSFITPRADIEINFRSVDAVLPSIADLAATGQKMRPNWTRYWVVLKCETHDGWVGWARQSYVMDSGHSRLRDRFGCTGVNWHDPFGSGRNDIDLDPEFSKQYPGGTYSWGDIYAWAVKHADEYQEAGYYRVPDGGATIRFTLYYGPNFGEERGEPTLPLALYPSGDFFELASATMIVTTTNPRPQQNTAPILSQQYGLAVPDPYGTLATTRAGHPEIVPANNQWDTALPPAPGPIVPVYDSQGLNVTLAEYEVRGAHRFWIGAKKVDLMGGGDCWDVDVPLSDTADATTPSADPAQPPALVVADSSGSVGATGTTGSRVPGIVEASGIPSWVKWAAIGVGVVALLAVVILLALKMRKGG